MPISNRLRPKEILELDHCASGWLDIYDHSTNPVKSLALMSQVETVMEMYDKGSPDLTYYTTLIDKLRVRTYATGPAFIQSNTPSGNGDQRAQLSGMMNSVGGQPGPHVGRPQAMQTDNNGINGDGNVPTAPNRVTFDSQLGRELRTHEHE